MKKKNLVILSASALLLLTFGGALVYYGTSIGCSPLPETEATVGSQGFRTWSGPTLSSFEHEDKKICIPEGWIALGEKEKGAEWARYESGVTGVAVSEIAFKTKILTFVYSAYEVTLLYPENTPAATLELYEATTRNAFERVGKLFNDSNKNTKRTHTVLVTPGVLRTDEQRIPIYPDPRENLSIYVQTPESPRGEELIIHAITHVYNRQRADLLSYQKNQHPIPAEDFQEFEASWSEIIYRTSESGRKARVAYMYNVHTAVREKKFSAMTVGPFNSNQTEFEKINQSVLVTPTSSFLTAQYGHYILAPLVMLGTEGLLSKKTDVTLENILTSLHAKNTNYFEALSAYVSADEIETVKSWMFEGAKIPYELVEAGLLRYSRE